MVRLTIMILLVMHSGSVESNQVILRIPLQLLLMQSEMKTKMKRHVGWVEQK